MKFVGAREANQKFSKLLAEVEEGETVVLTKHGREVARLVPGASRTAVDRQAAAESLRRSFELGIRLGGRRFTRDEMHER